ncbi:MAG: hypothetical protein HYY48_10335 [Gammaproteobacteria bacterium]|nr:hypothetical protein [Gammaproteobacteria bacterium]
MKNLVATLILAAAAGQVHADGFYQAVTDQTARAVNEAVSGERTEFAYSPLYLQVVGNGKRALELDAGPAVAVAEFSYTPLYLVVTGRNS